MQKIYKVLDLKNLYSTGIYKITCLSNNKIYVGSAFGTKNSSKKRNGFYRRWEEHIKSLRENNHHNKHLQSAWNKYSENSFEFEIIEICDLADAIDKEVYYIKLFKAADHNFGFNMLDGHLGNYKKHTEEHNRKISNSLKGKERPLEIVKKWSNEVQQFNEKMELIATYYSMSEAERKTGIMRQDIGQACIGIKIKKAGGFFWKKKLKI